MIGRPSEFSREWAYTSLSRAREPTRVYVVAEPTATQRQREEYAPPEPERTRDETLDVLTRAMRLREAEQLAIDAIEPEHVPTAQPGSAPSLPLAELPEAGAEQASAMPYMDAAVPGGRRAPGRNARWRERGDDLTRER